MKLNEITIQINSTKWGKKGIWGKIRQKTNIIVEIISRIMVLLGFPGGWDGKEFACSAGDLGSILGSERFPGERNGNPLQYSCLENSMNRGAWWATVHGVTKSGAQLTVHTTVILTHIK